MLDTVRIQLAGRAPLQRSDLAPDFCEDEQSLVLDARYLTWASPLELAAIVTLAVTAATRGRQPTLLLPHNDDVASYMARMDVLEHLDGIAKIDKTVVTQSRSDHRSKLMEVTGVTGANAAAVTETLGAMAVERLGPRVGIAAFKSLGELLDNATTHGQSDVGAFTAAQLYSGATSGRPGFEFAVCDAGVGILEHLRTSYRYQDLDDGRVALERALENGVSGTPECRGYGLGDLGDAVTRTGAGRLILRGAGAIASVRLRGQRPIISRSAVVPAEGTWALLRVKVS